MARENMSKVSLVVLVVFASSLGLHACGGGGTSTTTPPPPPPAAPTVTITASPNSLSQGQSATLTWSTTNATSCTASAAPAGSDWSGSQSSAGSQSVTPTSLGTINYALTCTGAGEVGPAAHLLPCPQRSQQRHISQSMLRRTLTPEYPSA